MLKEGTVLDEKYEILRKIGEGGIGLDALVSVINHPKLKDLPFFLETPNDLDGYKAEITLLRDNYKF